LTLTDCKEEIRLIWAGGNSFLQKAYESCMISC